MKLYIEENETIIIIITLFTNVEKIKVCIRENTFIGVFPPYLMVFRGTFL